MSARDPRSHSAPPRRLRPGQGLALVLLLCSLAQAGTLAQFRTVFGDIEVELFDPEKPVTVRNFIQYVETGRWQDLFIHRCDPGFVIQGGGYRVANRGATNQGIADVERFGTITNEFGVGRRFSNVYGTLAMAKVGGLTNSASSEWFFNLTNNPFLDAANSNGYFTVFGQVVRGTNVLNRFRTFTYSGTTNLIADLRVYLGSAFGELPLLTSAATYADLVYVDVTLLQVAVRGVAGGNEVSWNSAAGRTNRVEYTAGMPPVWQTLTATNGTGSRMTAIDPVAGDAFRFYRVRVDY